MHNLELLIIAFVVIGIIISLITIAVEPGKFLFGDAVKPLRQMTPAEEAKYELPKK